MLLRNVNLIDVHSVLEPPLILADLEIVTAHLPLTHTAVFRKGPVFETITTLPFHLVVSILVLVLFRRSSLSASFLDRNHRDVHTQNWTAILLSVNANSSLRNL